MFTHSICSYKQRGNYGNNSYRGNCSGFIIKDFIESFMMNKRGLFVDPSMGGGTSRDVAQELGIRYTGLDLHQGFNLLRDDLLTAIGEESNCIWWHPPYWDMIKYSGQQWGEPNKWDLSQLNLNDFIEALELSIMNIHDACETNGHYGILMGNLRRNGSYYNLSSMVERLAPAKLVDEIIKTQHNCTSDSNTYHHTLIRIAHEKLLVFRKTKSNKAVSLLGIINQRTDSMLTITWRAAVRRTLQGHQSLKLDAIYLALEPYANSRSNNHWKEKIRQVLQNSNFFTRLDVGLYTLAE